MAKLNFQLSVSSVFSATWSFRNHSMYWFTLL